MTFNQGETEPPRAGSARLESLFPNIEIDNVYSKKKSVTKKLRVYIAHISHARTANETRKNGAHLCDKANETHVV